MIKKFALFLSSITSLHSLRARTKTIPLMPNNRYINRLIEYHGLTKKEAIDFIREWTVSFYEYGFVSPEADADGAFDIIRRGMWIRLTSVDEAIEPLGFDRYGSRIYRRTYPGLDQVIKENADILAPISGVVSAATDSEIEITDKNCFVVSLINIEAQIITGERLKAGDKVGKSSGARKGLYNHARIEVKRPCGKHVNPVYYFFMQKQDNDPKRIHPALR